MRYPNSVWVNLRDKSKEVTSPQALEHYKGTHIITVGAKDEAALVCERGRREMRKADAKEAVQRNDPNFI